jgi:hypothetical protein
VSPQSTCSVCKHTAPSSDFPAYPLNVEGGQSPEVILQRLSDGLAQMFMRTCGIELATWLARSGLFWWAQSPVRDARDQEFRNRCAMRYAAAMGKGVVYGLLATRHELEKERVAHERSYRS